MDIDFYKLQTCGNDFILTNSPSLDFKDKKGLSKLASHLCRRDYGIGGNGFISIENFSADNISAYFFSPSGKPSQPSYDAALCLSRYIFDSGISGKEDFTLNINNRSYSIGLIDSNNFRISLGVPKDDDGNILIEEPYKEYSRLIRAGLKDYPVTVVNLERSGTVLFTEACTIEEMKDLSDKILQNPLLDRNTSLIFTTVYSRNEMQVFIRNSRGNDFSSSCALAAIAAVLNGFSDRETTVIHKDGEYYFQWLHPSNEVFITGSSDYIFSGSIYFEL